MPRADYARTALRTLVRKLPWGANEAVFEALLARMGPDQMMARVAPQLEHLQLSANGEYGLVQSAVNDGFLLSAYAKNGVYEPRMASLFGRFFAEHGGGTYLDIGANIGLTTLPVARDPRVHCLAFEADPTNAKHLAANVKRNCPHDNVRVHEIAVFCHSAMVNLARHRWNLGDHRLSLGDETTARQIVTVAAAPLDQYLDQLTGAVAAKIDVQGAEPLVVKGGRDVLSRVELLVIEFCPGAMRTLGGNPQVVLDYLSMFNRLAVCAARENDVPVFRPAHEGLAELGQFLATADRAGRAGETAYRDVFAVRELN
jgi:FkbM family methyltransferase